MNERIAEWFGRHRKTIGYTIGVINLLAGLSYMAQGQSGPGMLWIVIGFVILFDTWEFK